MIMKDYQFASGELLLIDKPLDWTSFDVVNKVRTLIKHKEKNAKIKVGHSGTLDPKATGLLLLGTGKKTKVLQELQGYDKEYTGEFMLGKTTPTYDTESEADKDFPIEHIDEKLLEETRKKFIGDLEQMPPIFSAVKVKGKRLYELARKGKEKDIKIEPRKITIFEFELTQIELPIVRFRVKCSKGTYIRSLAHDFGQALNSGAYLSSLRRTKIGAYTIEDATKLEDFIQEMKTD